MDPPPIEEASELFETRPGTSDGPQIEKDKIDDVVGFSLSSLCSIRSNFLYNEQTHESFRSQFLARLVDHFSLPKRSISSINQFIADDEFTFLSAIKQNYKDGSFRLIQELILAAISTGSYDARAHYLIIDVAETLGVPRDLVEIQCESIYNNLLEAQKHAADTEKDAEVDRDKAKRESRNKIKKYLIIGLASIGGGAVIGVTGGLAAPIVASAVAGVIGAGSVVMSTAAAGIIGSLFGVAGAGLTASKMNNRIGDLEEFSFLSLSPADEQTSLHITIAISGWISDEGGEQQFAKPWKYLRHTKEQYCLCYESKYLLELSRAMDYLLSFVVSYATQQALQFTFLASLVAAIAWPTALISIASIIDNPWDVCVSRSAQAGKHLADVLMSRQQGKRPASLIGFSLGARVIFFCLQELAQRKDSEGIIGDVVMLGAPVTASLDQWKPIGRVVSGKIVNGYSSSDWLLKFLYRTSSAAIRVAGLQEICWKDRRVKNIDLTPLVGGHMDYYRKLTEILEFVNIRTAVNFDPVDSSSDCLTASRIKLNDSPSSDSGIARPGSSLLTDLSPTASSSASQQSIAGCDANMTSSDLPSQGTSRTLNAQMVDHPHSMKQQQKTATVKSANIGHKAIRTAAARVSQHRARQLSDPTRYLMSVSHKRRSSSLTRRKALDLRSDIATTAPTTTTTTLGATSARLEACKDDRLRARSRSV